MQISIITDQTSLSVAGCLPFYSRCYEFMIWDVPNVHIDSSVVDDNEVGGITEANWPENVTSYF